MRSAMGTRTPVTTAKKTVKDAATEPKRPRGRPGPPPLSLAPLTVDEALEAMLRTPPPLKGEETRKPKARKRAKAKR